MQHIAKHWYIYIERSGWMSLSATGTWTPCKTKFSSNTAHILHKFDAQWPFLFNM